MIQACNPQAVLPWVQGSLCTEPLPTPVAVAQCLPALSRKFRDSESPTPSYPATAKLSISSNIDLQLHV